jgi:hypothetical protein
MKISSSNVAHYLLDAGICQKQDIKLMSIIPRPSKGRNNLIYLTIVLPNTRHLFLSQDSHLHNLDHIKKIKVEWQIHEFLQTCPELASILNMKLKIIHFDELSSILIHECPKDLVDLESYYISQKAFSTGIAELMGTTLAYIHHETLISHKLYDFMSKVKGKPCYQFPYPNHLLERVTPETLMEEFTPEGYGFLAFYQQAETLKAAVTELVATQRYLCLTHNNLQLNNILIPKHWDHLSPQIKQSGESIIKLLNWESCSWGSPAFDLGTVIASYLLLWLNSLIRHSAISLEQSLQLATIPLEVIQPSIVAFIRAYINNFPEILEKYPNFFRRVVQFTGLALIYKIIEMIQYFQDFNNQSTSILQLSKRLICKPEESLISVFGITESALVELSS